MACHPDISTALVDRGAEGDDTHSDAFEALDDKGNDFGEDYSGQSLDCTDAGALNNQGCADFEDIAYSMSDLQSQVSDGKFLPGFAREFASWFEFYDFACVSVAAEMHCGKVLDLSLEEARTFAEERFPTIMWNTAEFSSVKICSITYPSKVALSIKQVPLLWINRCVLVRLEFGNVMGILSDASLRDVTHLYLMPFPGEPEIPPLPSSEILGVLRVPSVMHASMQLSQDGLVEVHKYFLQKGESVWVRELHVAIDSPIKTDIIGGCTCAQDSKFHMWYQRTLSEDGNVSAAFYRFPAPCEPEGDGAENDDWRLRWAVPNIHIAVMPNLNEYHCEFNRDYLEFLAETCDNEESSPSGDSLKFCLWNAARFRDGRHHHDQMH
jgi:hypothetical protein